jgi:hypothetical protein
MPYNIHVSQLLLWSKLRKRKFMKSLPGSFRLKVVSNELTPNVNVLKELAGSTENEFLFIGEKLLDFHQRASAIAAMTTDAVGQISGGEMGKIIENFESALEMAASLTGGFASQKRYSSINAGQFFTNSRSADRV